MNQLPPTASHLHLLEQELQRLEPGSFVVEHGCGMYSSFVIADHIRGGAVTRLAVIEQDVTWGAWVRWMYTRTGVTLDVREHQHGLKVDEAAFVFIDGMAKERIKLLDRSLKSGVPAVVMHDTEPDNWHHYDLRGDWFSFPGYDIEHHFDNTRRTTVWRKR